MTVFTPDHVRPWRMVSTALLVSLLAGCSGFGDATRRMADAMTLYRPEVVQGNFVSKEQVDALQPGMTRIQVRDILGTPLVTSLFHHDRWDYVFTIRRQGVDPQTYRLTVFFSGDALARHEGDAMPSETEFIGRIGRPRNVKVPALEATDEQLARFPAAAASASGRATPPEATRDAAPVPRNYPPLEPAR